MAWPKGKPRKPKPPETPAVKGIVSAPAETGGEKKALTGVASTRREGGKAALMAESANIAAQEKISEGEKTERDKIEERYLQETYPDLETSETTDTTVEEQSQETEETTSTSEEVQSEAEETEEAPSETVEEQEQEKTYTETEHKAAIDRMHQATTEAANYRKYLEEISPHVNWDKFTQGKTEQGVAGPEAPKAEMPTQEEFISDYDSWIKKFSKFTASNQSPEIQNMIHQQNEYQTCLKEFNEEFKELPGGPEMFHPNLAALANKKGQEDPTFLRKSYRERYNILMPEFREFAKAFKQPVTQPTKKKIPLESPSKAKEREPSGPEKPLTWDDVEKDRMDYVQFRMKETKRLKGGY